MTLQEKLDDAKAEGRAEEIARLIKLRLADKSIEEIGEYLELLREGCD